MGGGGESPFLKGKDSLSKVALVLCSSEICEILFGTTAWLGLPFLVKLSTQFMVAVLLQTPP